MNIVLNKVFSVELLYFTYSDIYKWIFALTHLSTEILYFMHLWQWHFLFKTTNNWLLSKLLHIRICIYWISTTQVFKCAFSATQPNL